MGRIKLEDNFIKRLQNTLDLTVENTGYPVLAKHLEQIGVANRKQLRALENKGLIKSVKVQKHQPKIDPLGALFGKTSTVYTAYYTERNIPSYIKQQAE